MSKIAISLPDTVLAAVEAARKRTGESRSQFLRRAAEQAIREESNRLLDDQYEEAYRKLPETPEDHPLSRRSVRSVLEKSPWGPAVEEG